MASPFEELQAKLTKAVEENTKAQAKATEMTGEHGKALRRLSRDTAQQKKRAAFLERDLKQELEDSLFAPFDALGKMIPKPIKLMAQMPFQAAMRGGAGGAAPRVDPSGTIMPPAGGDGGALKGAFSEAMGREISTKGYMEGVKAMIPGFGTPLEDKTEDLLGKLVDLGSDHTKLLEDIAEALEAPRKENLGKGAGFREPGIEKIIDPKTGKPFGARGAAAGGGVLLGAGGAGGGGPGIDWDSAAETGAGVGGGLLAWTGIKKLLGLGKVGAGGAAAAAGGAGGGAAAAGGLAALGGKMGVVGLLTSIAMTGKDAYDLWTSAEERMSKKAENVGGLIGSLVGALGFVGGPLVGAMTMILGNTIGEMIGKSIDADRDPRVKAQMGALGAELDKLKDAREDVLDANMSNLLKQKKLTEIDKKIATVRTEAQEIEDRENEVERLNLKKERTMLLEQKEASGRIATTWILNAEMKESFVRENEGILKSLIKGEVTADKLNDAFVAVEDRESQYQHNKVIYLKGLEASDARIAAYVAAGRDREAAEWRKKQQTAKDNFEKSFAISADQQKFRDAYTAQIQAQRIAETTKYDAEIKAIDKRLGILSGETDEAAGMVDWEARLRGDAETYNKQRTAVDVGPGLHDVPAGKGFGQHAQELMAGKEWEEFDPTQTKGAKAMQAMFGETMPGLTSYSHTPGPIGAAGFGPGEEGAKRFNIYTSDAYKAAVAASEGGDVDNVDDTLMAMQSVFSTGRFTGGPGITEDAKGKKMFKYSELQAMKERMGGYDDKFLTHRGEKIIGDEARTALQMDKLETDEWDPTKKDMGQDQWVQYQIDDDAMTHMGGPKIGQAKGGGRYLSSAAASGGLGSLQDAALEFYGTTVSGGRYSKLKGESRSGGMLASDTFESDVGQSFLSTGTGTGATTAVFSRMLQTQDEVVEGMGKDKTEVTKTSETLSSVMFQTFKDGFFEIAAGVGDETKMVAGQIKTEDDITNVIENLASLTGEGLDSTVLSGLKEQLQKSLKTGHFGMEDLTKTGRIEQVGPHGDAWKVTKKGEELYAKSFGQGGRQLGVPGAAMGGTEESKRARMLAGMSPDAGETPRDLMLAELAWGANTEVRTERTGPQRGGRGSETAPALGIGGTKPYMTMNGATTYALPPSSGVQGTPIPDPYEGRARDPESGRLLPLDEKTQDEIAEADKTTAQVLTDVKIGTKSSLGVTLVDPSGKVLELGQSLTKQSDAMYQGRMGGGEFTPEASAEERLYGGLGGMVTKMTTGEEVTDKELLDTEQAAKEYQAEMAQVLSSVKIGSQSSLGVTLVDAAGKVLDWWKGSGSQGALDVITGRKMGGTSEHFDARGQAIQSFLGMGATNEEALELKDYFGGMQWSANASALPATGMNLPMDAALAGIYQYGQMAVGETFSGATGDAWRNIKGSAAAVGEGRMSQQEMLQKSIQISSLPAERKRALLDAGAVASSSASGGGGTNVVVNAPSTSNSNSTVQKIDANPLTSQNPRRPVGVHYG